MTAPNPDAVPRFDPETEAELDQAAEIREEDIEDARLAWREVASPLFRTLLDAEPDPPPL